MISVDEAVRVILDRTPRLGVERVPLHEAVGRVVAETVSARRELPPWDNSAMDGYAVRAADVRVPDITLPVVDEIAAGDAGERPLVAGSVARIFTGAPMPPGADAVIIQENANRDGDRVTFGVAATAGANIRRRGTDVTEGARVVSSGRVLLPGDIGLMAAQGRSLATVYRRPIVSIASSGDELVDVDGGEPGPGQIVNSNVIALAAAVRAAGAIPRMLPTVPDEREATFEAMRLGARDDALITSGGMSVGTYDYVRDALVELTGDEFQFWKVAVKPGKPLGYGHIGDCAVFGLPGNPISALVTFELFVRPALRQMMGYPDVLRRWETAVLATPLPAGGKRRRYMRASTTRDADGRLVVDPARNQSSGALSSLTGADALVVVPVDAPPRAAGDSVDAILLT